MVDIEELFGELDALCKLKSEIRKEDKLKFGDEDSIEYKRLYDDFIRKMPKTEEKFIDFVEDIQCYCDDLRISLKEEKGIKEELMDGMRKLIKRYEESHSF